MSNKTKTDTTTQETKNKLDPRMDALLYGDQGILNRAQALGSQPAINDRMRQGMDAKANYLQSPLYQAIFNQILGQGQNLMSGGVAGNPFNRGGMGFTGSSGMPSMGYKPNYTQQPQSQQTQAPLQAMPAPQQAPQQSQLTPEELRYIQLMSGQHYQSQNGG